MNQPRLTCPSYVQVGLLPGHQPAQPRVYPGGGLPHEEAPQVDGVVPALAAFPADAVVHHEVGVGLVDEPVHYPAGEHGVGVRYLPVDLDDGVLREVNQFILVEEQVLDDGAQYGYPG